MSENSHKVFPLKRIAAAIYDLLLLLGVWFASGSIAVWINGGIIESKWIGPLIVFLSTWIFYGYFWTHGGKKHLEWRSGNLKFTVSIKNQ